MPQPIKALLAVLLAAVFSSLNFSFSAAAVISADTNGGYAAKVLDLLLENWTVPVGASGSTSVIVRITNEGKPFSCELRKGSGNAAVDDAICMAVAKTASFPPPPYAMPAEVALTFVYQENMPAPSATQQPQKSYADIIQENARAHLTLPKKLKGKHSTKVRLRILGDASLGEYKVEKSSGSADFDAAVLRALLHPGVIVSPPDGKEQIVFLTFSVSDK